MIHFLAKVCFGIITDVMHYYRIQNINHNCHETIILQSGQTANKGKIKTHKKRSIINNLGLKCKAGKNCLSVSKYVNPIHKTL